MDLVTLRAGDLEAVVGATICPSLRHRGEEVLGQRRGLDAYLEQGATMGVPLLYPWANRVAATRFEALGREVDLDRAPGRWRRDGETGLPIHGLLLTRAPWRRADDAAWALDWGDDAELLAAFPFPHRLATRWELGEGGLRVTTSVTPARGEEPVPVAFGFHPYLLLPGEPRAGWRVTLPVRRRLVLDERKLPSGATEDAEPWSGALGDRTFDDGYDRLAGERPAFVLAGERRTITVTFERGYGCAQVFAPPADEVVAFEPMTAPANAVASGHGLLRAPHEAVFEVAVR